MVRSTTTTMATTKTTQCCCGSAKPGRGSADRVLLFAGIAAFAFVALMAICARGQSLTLVNPNWEINLTDAGYSDYLGDLTPGFEGREYLSGEWAAAVSYSVDGNTVAPTWLEPNFIYPDWTTNSNFSVVQGIAETGVNADGLPIAESIIENGDLRITLRFEMIDTITGTPMGTVKKSAGGSGASVRSNRYVLKQTYAIENIGEQTISDLQLFQFLHGLNSLAGVYDDRSYAGPMAEYRYDTTLNGTDPYAIGASPDGVQDYIAFHSSVLPTAVELGAYGIEIDNHGIGKPSDGVHLSVENNWNDEPYASRLGTDAYAVGTNGAQWVAGAERWDLATLAPHASISADVLLSILTGTKVLGQPSDDKNPASGSCNGGSGSIGGVDYDFEDVTLDGSLFAEYSRADEDEIAEHIAEGEYDAPDFLIAGSIMQIWSMDFTGEFDGIVQLTFAFDPSLLSSVDDLASLSIYHFNGHVWENVGGVVDAALGTITIQTSSLSPFALGVVVPEPAGAALAVVVLTLAIARIPRRRCRR